MSKKIIQITVLIFPIIAMLALIGVHTNNQTKGDLWIVPVTGYDPRDLLRGHYLTFRFDWNWEDEEAKCQNDNCAVCLAEDSNDQGRYENPKVRLNFANVARKECASYIKGYGGRTTSFNIGTRKSSNNLRRYYIPEEHARHLDYALRRQGATHKFSLGLRVNENGNAFIERMYINGVPLEQWVKDNPNER